jgi:hypothetical protein
VLAAMALVAVLASPASAQINVSPSVGVGDIVSDNDVTAQCIGDPLLDLGGAPTLELNEDQCADDGSTNTDGGLL